jgi:hypothetical protein
VAGRTIESIQLRKHLRANLPEYMIPQHFLTVESIPMTPNGKVDRRSLPVPVVTDSRIGRREAPATPAEAVIAEIWTALVKPERPVGREDRFFEIGGHSLLGLEALRQIEERLGVRLHARILFLENLAGIARQCGDGSAAGHEVAPASRPSPLPPKTRLLLSDMQEYVYNEVKESPDTLAFHIPFSFRAGPSLDVPRFEASLRDVFDRHAALRCAIREDDSGAYLAIRDTDRVFHLEHHDLRHEEDGQAAAMATMIAATKEAFDVREGPLVRMHLMRLAGGEHVFLFMPHQLVFDGWSFDLFLRELDSAYANGGRSPDPANRVDFPDYSTWQRSSGEAMAPVLAFWKGELRNAPSLDWPVASASGEAPGRIQFRIPAEQVRRCEELCKPANLKLQSLLLAVFAKVVAATTGRNDLMIGLAASGRYLPETATMIGPFYRNLPLGVPVPEDGGLMALAEDVQRRSDRIAEHQDIPYWTLAELAGSPTALDSFGRLAFSFQEARGRTLRVGDVALSQISVPRPGMVADLEFWLRNTPECLIASLDCRNGQPDEPLMQALRDDYLAMLDAVIAGGSAATSGRAAQLYAAALGRHSEEGNGRGNPSPLRPSRRAHL